MKITKVLVTGGAGAIGFQLCKKLIAQGYYIYLVDNYLRSERDEEVITLSKHDNVKEIECDLSDPQQCANLPNDIEYIYHMAAFNGTQNFYEYPFDVMKHSTLPTIHLLQKYADNKKVKKFVYAGSSESYASSIKNFGWEIPTAENVPLGIDNPQNVRWSYGGSKLHGEIATVAAGNQFNMPYTIIRFHNVYGPRMGDKHFIPDFLARLKEGKYELYGYDDTRSFIYVEDAVNAVIQCAESLQTNNEIIHLGDDEEKKILDVAHLIMKIKNISEEIKCFPSPEGSVKRRVPNLSKLKNLISFKKSFSLEDGLKETIKYYSNK